MYKYLSFLHIYHTLSTKMNLPDDFKLFNDLDRSIPVRERVRICAERHIKNYFIGVPAISIPVHSKPNVPVVTEDLVRTYVNKTVKLNNKRYAFCLYHSNPNIRVSFERDLQAVPDITGAVKLAEEYWKLHGQYSSGQNTKAKTVSSAGDNKKIKQVIALEALIKDVLLQDDPLYIVATLRDVLQEERGTLFVDPVTDVDARAILISRCIEENM